MLIAGTNLVLRLYYQPAVAMSDILDQGSLLFSSVAVLAVSLALGHSLTGLSFPFYAPLFVLAAFYVPGILLIGGLLGGVTTGSGIAFQRDYAPLLTCASAAWAAAGLPLLGIAWLLPQLFAAASGVACLYFAVLIFFAVRTVFGTGKRRRYSDCVFIVDSAGRGVFSLGSAALFVGLAGLAVFPVLHFFLFSAAAHSANLGAGTAAYARAFAGIWRPAAVNPHDGEAQYQLGLIYQQRRQYTEAIRRFQNAVAIDPAETDAHFQLGRIAREQGRLKDALAHFQTVVDQDEKHSQSEILRELGALYISARQYEDARQELAKYEERRPYDAEGLFYYGQALEGLGKVPEAREKYGRASEAASLAPSYIRRSAARWSRVARKQLRRLAQ